RAHGNDLARINAILRPSLTSAFASESQKFSFQLQMYIPDLFVWNIHNAIPERNVVVTIHPFRAEIPIEQQTEFLSDPCRSVNAIRNGRDGDFIFGQIRPYDLPHAARDSAMQMAHSVSPSRHPQRENSHIERVAKAAKLHEFLLGDAEIVP